MAGTLLISVVTTPAAHAEDPAVAASNSVRSIVLTNAPAIISGPAHGAVAEHAEGATTAVADYAATDLDAGTTIVWSLSGDDAGHFSVDADGAVGFRTAPDYERAGDADTDNDYEVTVVAADGVGPSALSDSRHLTVRVTDVNETPRISPYLANDSVAENSNDLFVAYAAADPEGDQLVWTLGGDDANIFRVQQLGITPVHAVLFKTPPDFENPQSADGDNTYTFTVSVGDGNTSTAPRDASVTVTNVDEDGILTIPPSPQVGTVMQATLADPDGGLSALSWTWERSSDLGDWSVILAAVSAEYTPTEADRNQYVRVSVSYTDGHGPGKGAQAVSASRAGATGPTSVPSTSPSGDAAGAIKNRRAFEVFDDVAQDAYYEASVTWMLKNNVTFGCSDGSFCPTEPVTRQQFVTFLWRAAGSPAPENAGSDTFGDVAAGGYADNAIGWAIEHQITVGCTGSAEEVDRQFCPDDPTTRAQAAAFIHRYHTNTASGPGPAPGG